MVRPRLVRQSAMNISSGSSDGAMASPQHVRRRRHSKDSSSFRQLSSESLDNLLISPSPGSDRATNAERKPSGRRHSLACGVLTIDVQGSSFKSALNSAVKKVSSACSVLSSAPSTTFNLSPPPPKEDQIILPPVLATFHRDRLPIPANCTFYNKGYHSNRRFSSDRPPPIYNEAWKQQQVAVSKQKLTRQQEVYVSRGSQHGSVEDDAFENFEHRLVN